MGTHCSGKQTIGQALGKLWNCEFHLELGDIMRDKDQLQTNGHQTGNGTLTEHATKWDNRIYKAEKERDDQSQGLNRIVETWHIGNWLWSQSRQTTHSKNEQTDRLLSNVQRAIQESMRKSLILFVLLEIDVATSVRRRRTNDVNARRLPMSEETTECERLHQHLQVNAKSWISKLAPGAPLVVVNNDSDGTIEQTCNQIQLFFDQHEWRRAHRAD